MSDIVLFNNQADGYYVYSRNDKIRREIGEAVLHQGEISYLSPELVLLYKSTDIARKENQQDFDTMVSTLSNDSREWLYNALIIAYTGEHEWRIKLEKAT